MDPQQRHSRPNERDNSSKAKAIVELTLDRPADGGAAVGRDAVGRVVFAHGGLAGETVAVELTAQKKSFARGHVVTVIEASPDRCTPTCPTHSAGCGGCDLAHATTTAQAAAKRHVVRDSLTRISRLEPDLVDMALQTGDAAVHTPIPARYRTTVRLAVADGRVGYRRRGSHDIVVPETCGVAHPALEQLITSVAVRSGGASELVLRVSAHTGEAVVATNGDPEAVTTGDVAAQVVSRSDVASGAITEFAGGRTWRVSAQSFFQAGPEVASALVGAVQFAAGDLDGQRVVDAYAGIGLFSGTVAEGASLVTAVEQSPSSTADARHNLAEGPAEVVVADVEDWKPNPVDVVIADPSRAGLGQPGVDVLAACGAERFVLVSCDTGSLGRDVALLGAAGYVLESVQLVDAFHDTNHTEVVSLLVR